MVFQFPDPNVTPEFTGDNGITYSWDATDGKWVIKGFSSNKQERYPDLVMQLRGYFELNGNGEAVLPDGIIYDSDIMGGPDGTDVYVMRPGIWWLDPTQSSAVRYQPETITHFLVSGLRWIDVIDGDGNEIFNEAATTQEFEEGDLIHIRSRATEIYADPTYAESYGSEFDHVWRITKKIEVVDDNNVGYGWGFGDTLWAYEVEKCAPEERYKNGFWPLNDDTFIPARISHWHGASKDEVSALNEEVFGEPEIREGPLGRSEFRAYAWNTSSTVDAVSKQSYFHPEENFCAFNHDLIPNGRLDWEEALGPYPRQILLKFDDGDELIFTVEFRGVDGHNNRSKNYTITDRGNLPLDLDTFIYNQRQFDVYLYTPERKSLQQQIDELRALLP